MVSISTAEAPDRLPGFFMLGWPSGELFTGSRRPLSEKVRWVNSAHDQVV